MCALSKGDHQRTAWHSYPDNQNVTVITANLLQNQDANHLCAFDALGARNGAWPFRYGTGRHCLLSMATSLGD